MSEETVVQEPAKPEKKGALRKMLMVVLLALASSAGGGLVSFIMINRTLSKPVAAAAEGEGEEQEKLIQMLQKSAVLPLEPFVVNLADSEAPRYLRINISLMVDDKTKIKELSENQPLQLKVRDVILQSLTAKKSRDLITEEGKNNLRTEIREKVSMYFHEPKLVDVMFTEFVIQL